MLIGANRLADAVAATMGPKGRNVVIEQSYGPPKVTKDGVTVAKAIDLADRVQNLGANLIKQVASKTNDEAGDGTTCATVLARAIYAEGCKAVAAGLNPLDLKRGIDAAVKVVIADLKANAKQISTPHEISQVASIAANGDKVIGNLISKAFEKVGKEGTITVTEGKTLEHELELVEGMKFDRGYISPYFVTDAKTQKVELENPLILLFDKKISTIAAILPILEHVVKVQRPLVIVAEDVDGEALATLVVNKLRGGLSVCAVKAPGFGDHRKALMQDIAVLSGGELISEEVGKKLESKDTIGALGSAKSITITKDDTIILNGSGSGKDIKARCDQIRSLVDHTTSEYEKEKLKERLAKLSGGVAVIKVGGSSEVEVGEVKDRITDALCATKAAAEEGIVPGGGVALLRASRKLDQALIDKDNFDQKIGVDIVRKACEIPVKTICQNAGFEGPVVVQNLLKSETYSYGLNASTGEYVDMVAKGIIDPTKVVRTALADAASVASLMTTTECIVVDKPKDSRSGMGKGRPSGGMGEDFGAGDEMY